MYSVLVLLLLIVIVYGLAEAGTPAQQAVGSSNSGCQQAAGAALPTMAMADLVAQEQGAAALGQLAYAGIDSQRSRPPIEAVCAETPPCAPQVEWRNIYPGCGSFHIPLTGKVAPKDNRIWQGDLNPLIQERMALLNKDPNPYEFMNARQAWIQFISTNWDGRKDPYTRAVSSLDEVDTRCTNEIEP